MKRKILLALEEVTESGTEVWVPPGGGLEPDDASVVECLRREFLEETGLSIEVGALLYGREGPEAETDTHGIELYFAVHSPRCFFFQAEDGIRAPLVTGVQTCALPI